MGKELTYKNLYMLTVIYSNGRSVDIKFESKEDRRDFFKCIKESDCKFTFWEMERVREEGEEEDGNN